MGIALMRDFLFTSESVSEGHPDKVADQISDALLDSFLTQDPFSRVACETLLTKGLVVVAGEVSTKGYVDIGKTVRNLLKNIGYDRGDKGFDYKSCSVLTTINAQSVDIAQGVGQGPSQGAGDQGLVFGYAVDETKEYMPLSISLCHQLVKNLSHLRKEGSSSLQIWPDSKSQVSVEYQGGRVHRISSVVVACQHAPEVSTDQLKDFIIENLINKTLPSSYMDKNTRIYINPTGRFVHGGPAADCGLTGRKLIVDTYGGHGAHGGGCFSGKDPSKVDRSGAYAARHIAKNIVAAGLATKCLVQIAYVIGMAEPVSFMVEDYGTLKVSKTKLVQVIKKLWNLSPSSLISRYHLLKPVYLKTAAYGHFGRPEFSWEKLDQVQALKDEFASVL